jgi:hypothetical protein
MLTAKEARLRARDDATIHSEISSLETAILTAVGQGLLTVAVNNSTMTSGANASVYWNVWQGNTDDLAKQDQIDQVIKYFETLSYTIEQRTNSQTGNTFGWIIAW